MELKQSQGGLIMFNELNKVYKDTVREGIDTMSMEFKPLKDFEGKTLKVDGFFFTKGKYGRQVVVVANGYKVNMPKRAVKTFKSIEANDFMLKAVMEGKLEIINIKEIETSSGNDTVSFELHDC